MQNAQRIEGFRDKVGQVKLSAILMQDEEQRLRQSIFLEGGVEPLVYLAAPDPFQEE